MLNVTISSGGASTTFHMLNEESRKYFQRAMVMSGSIFSYFALTEGNHLEKIQKCTPKTDIIETIEYLRTANASDIVRCNFRDDWGKTLKPEWVPTIEPKGTKNAIITQSPDNIWNSKNAPVIDTLFSFTSKVFYFLICSIESRFII